MDVEETTITLTRILRGAPVEIILELVEIMVEEVVEVDLMDPNQCVRFVVVMAIL